MPLLPFFESAPDHVATLTIEQIVAMAGDGTLKDGSPGQIELRDFLTKISSSDLARYIEGCLSASFTKSGQVLQDLVNEIGRRLNYTVENGLYQGVTNKIGFDGLWSSPEGQDLVVEVKTTDAYRLSLDTLANYRSKLLAAERISASSSVLIVVGRQDTGELEAQIRGSRHAWDMRLISAEALVRLLRVMESTDTPSTSLQIRSLLVPLEYTRLDRIVDVMFDTVAEVEDVVALDATLDALELQLHLGEAGNVSTPADAKASDPEAIQKVRDEVVAAMAKKLGVSLVKKSRALFWDPTHSVRIACAVSKVYPHDAYQGFWYAYHPQWHDFIGSDPLGYYVLGCVGLDKAYAIPRDQMEAILPHLHTTTRSGGTYSHIRLQYADDQMSLVVPHNPLLDLSPYEVALN